MKNVILIILFTYSLSVSAKNKLNLNNTNKVSQDRFKRNLVLQKDSNLTLHYHCETYSEYNSSGQLISSATCCGHVTTVPLNQYVKDINALYNCARNSASTMRAIALSSN